MAPRGKHTSPPSFLRLLTPNAHRALTGDHRRNACRQSRKQSSGQCRRKEKLCGQSPASPGRAWTSDDSGREVALTGRTPRDTRSHQGQAAPKQ